MPMNKEFDNVWNVRVRTKRIVTLLYIDVTFEWNVGGF